ATDSHLQAVSDEYFRRLGQLLIRLLAESTEQGICYRVDMRLRPYGQQGELVADFQEALQYYDTKGRTWERQAFIKARAVAGDMDLGRDFVDQLRPWVYRRYLMRADITGISAMKRRMERRWQNANSDIRDVKHGCGGIRDLETVVQFLQLLHGGDDPTLHCTNTLETIHRLELSGCITADEKNVLATNYCYLRRLEHYLQIMFDRQTHKLPASVAEMQEFVSRIHYLDDSGEAGPERHAKFQQEFDERRQQSRRVLEHLLHQAFADNPQVTAEADLILDPEPETEAIKSLLGSYGFQDPLAAYKHVQELAAETIPFLSTRRCRHFLAAIAPELLKAIAATPHPDSTLIALANVSHSIGGKAVLWELFSFNPATMDLCLRMCAGSPYLTGILTGNPGMIDELLDSLMLEGLPSLDELQNQLDELCRGADDIGPIVHSFKNSMHLRAGVRNILGKDDIATTHAALSDIAEVCIAQVIRHEFHRLIKQIGFPVQHGASSLAPGNPISVPVNPAELVVLAIGKLGGREPNYHSDIDLLFLFDSEGQTQSLVPDRRFRPTTNRHFFNQLCQRVIHAITRSSAAGRLYDIDVRLRPLGKSGELAITVDDLTTYFANGQGRAWERQALCKARPIWGSPSIQKATMQRVYDIICQCGEPERIAASVREQRMQLEAGINDRNVKRGFGGTTDVEFVVQLLQMVHAADCRECLVSGTQDALTLLSQHGFIDSVTAETLTQNYAFLRRVESGLRLMNLTARHEIPAHAFELETL
ncbi:MAG: bifunctional [glutamate--ammonia ligase]-adenylyl-L-tyrosine phosphorylase/[glutamate--ammonia-ligase] adenylyltransferase, partial [Anaerolineae bacterium]|nr:bifunctional [glutamate--ammonia ligase]-adenylyl-L-tyrosine phosphorylase/[glutamate--ammonia-ligase] adenylyltransferase [Anaerolineae bacterium]